MEAIQNFIGAFSERLQNVLCWLDMHQGFGTGAQWLSALVALAAFIIAIRSGLSAVRQWHLRYLTEEWMKTHEFLVRHIDYLDPDKNSNYTSVYQDKEKILYELVARRSIAYIDDVLSLGMHSHLEAWLKGSVDLFVKPHKKWFDDHKELYAPKVVKYIESKLK